MSDKPASRYEAKQSQAVESNHANHRPPVSWCRKCRGKPAEYRSTSGHLAMDPSTGATVLEPHEE